MKSITIQYFAVLRDKCGRDSETVQTESVTVEDLFEELCERHDLHISKTSLKVAVNDEFSDWPYELCDSDTVVFIPPVAGG